MNQAFFSLSVGMGGMAIFGSYIGKDHSLVGESLHVIFLDSIRSSAGRHHHLPGLLHLQILEVTAGPSLLFDTMASVFTHIPGGRWWGALFFLFMVFAALSTVLGVCENIVAIDPGADRLVLHPRAAPSAAWGIFPLALKQHQLNMSLTFAPAH